MYSSTYYVSSDNYKGKSQLRKYKPDTYTLQDVVNQNKKN